LSEILLGGNSREENESELNVPADAGAHRAACPHLTEPWTVRESI